MIPRNDFKVGDNVTLKSEGITRGVVLALNLKGDVFVHWFDKERNTTIERPIDLEKIRKSQNADG